MANLSFKSAGADGISLLSSLISDINSKQVAKRTLFSNLPFEIGPNFRISVKGYNILQKQKPARTTFIYMEGEEAQIVAGETSRISGDETSRPVDKEEIKKAYKFGGDVVLFTPEEQKELKNFGSPILRIIGFKPLSKLPFWASMNKSTFIYPSEAAYVGSTRVFSALWRKLLKDEKVGLAWYIARVNSSPSLVAIIPSQEKLDDNGGQLIPQGLWLYPLPAADDIRHPPETLSPIPASDDLVNAMRKVIQQVSQPNQPLPY
jgi:ATP-dependent DNA helicase 2 subunit 1